MAREMQTLNVYAGTDAVGNNSTVIAEDMQTAALIYKTLNDVDPIMLQRTKKGVLCALPDIYVTFTTEAYDQTTQQIITACTVTPGTFTVLGNSKQVFTATAAEGYVFVRWQIDGEDVKDSDDNLVTNAVAQLTIPPSNVSCKVRAVFKLED